MERDTCILYRNITGTLMKKKTHHQAFNSIKLNRTEYKKMYLSSFFDFTKKKVSTLWYTRFVKLVEEKSFFYCSLVTLYAIQKSQSSNEAVAIAGLNVYPAVERLILRNTSKNVLQVSQSVCFPFLKVDTLKV